MLREDRPSLFLSTLVVVAVTLTWGLVRLVIFRDSVLPLTYVLPLMLGVWTRRYWQVWGMAGAFGLMAALKTYFVLPTSALSDAGDRLFLGATLFNIVVGAGVVHAIVRLRANLEERNRRITAQNAELEAQAEELSQQNEEIRTQSEELAQQNEEIEAQAEELAGQNEELHATNERLASREDVLQNLLETVRTPEDGRRTLTDVCRRARRILGAPAEIVAIFEADGPGVTRVAEAGADASAPLPETWPLAGSVAGVVFERGQTAYVSDLMQEPKLAAPFGADARARSVLATPLRVGGKIDGVVVACSAHAAHWTQEQFVVLEWIAAQCGLLVESQRWQRELLKRTRESEAANRAKDQFLAMLSHELRTPLTPVLAAAGLLENDARLPEDVQADLAMIRRNVAIQSRLIDDLLDLTRLGRGKLEIDRQPLEAARLIEETAAIVAPDLDAHEQVLSFDLTAAANGVVRGDRPRLQQVFWNLLKNAIKFSPPRSVIRVSARRVAATPERIAFDVRDEGIGIAPEDVARIFQPFEQVVVGGKQRGGDAGLGLGLAIAKAIIDLHHGSLTVSSEGRGQGATFTVELPLETNPIANGIQRSRSPLSESPTNAKLRILLVEDHGDTGRVLARLIRNDGHELVHAETAGQALAEFQAGRFDLLVSDLGLPDENGLELMRKLRARQPDLPGICLSGYGMEDDVQACRAAGFHEHLTKPVEMQRMRAAISRVAAQSS